MIDNLVTIVKNMDVDTLNKVSSLIDNISDLFGSNEFKSSFSKEEMQSLDNLMGDYSDGVLISYIVSESIKGELK